jgi:hypothetical protein
VTTSSTASTNTAASWSTVGIQAGGDVHDSTVYNIYSGASPREKYEVGVRFLEDGVPARSRDLIHDAMAHGYENGEVRFHWVLAMLSKRSYRDLTAEEREQLGRVSEFLHRYFDDEWKRALEAICELLDYLIGSGGDPGVSLRKLHALPTRQRDEIVRHLDLVLTGGMKDSLWVEKHQKATTDRLRNDRRDRMWAYFQPVPAKPRVRQPLRDSTTAGDLFRAIAWSGTFAFAVGYFGWKILVHAAPLPTLSYLLMLAAGYVGARTGWEWYYRATRLKIKDRYYFRRRGVDRAPEGGFANQVDHSFTHYFIKYAPEGRDRTAWLADTAGIRATLRDEIVELYRESRTSAAEVRWLIRYLVNEVKKRWKSGTLLQHQERYRTRSSTKAWCAISLATLIVAATSVILTTIQIDPLRAAVATLVATAGARLGTARWLNIFYERRRAMEDLFEFEQLQRERQAAYQEWKKRLDSTRPSESEMEAWLNCDKTILLHDALHHYRLAWREIIAHAVLQTPAKPCKRSRVRNGPWRYSKYDIRLFLVTQDGVREITTELDFERVDCSDRERNNFRFDAVSSVQVTKEHESHTLDLTLMNGPSRTIIVPGLKGNHLDPTENAEKFSEINLDAAGFTHTLHILEGIAAEGKGWIDRDPHTRGHFDEPILTTPET